MWQTDLLIDKITLLIQTLTHGSWVDPEWDFASYRELDPVDRDQANPTIYAKTWKLIHTTRSHKPLQLIFYFDLNGNVKTRLHEWGRLLCKEVITHFQGEMQIEIKDGHNHTLFLDSFREMMPDASSSMNHTYHSDIAPILDYAQHNLYQGNIVLIISDFLYLMTNEGESLCWLSCRSNSLLIPWLVPLPSRWLNFHRYYISYPLEKLPFDTTFS